MNIGGCNIGFAGPSHVRDGDTNPDHRLWRILAERIGQEAMRRGHRLITGGCSGGLTQHCVESAKQWLEDHGRGFQQELRITSIVSREKAPTVKVGRELVCGDWSRNQRRVYMASLMDSLITVEGKSGTRREGQCAFCVGTPVIPIWGTGGNSLELRNQIEKEFSTHPFYEGLIGSKAWDDLGQTRTDAPKHTVANAVDLAVAMAERKRKFHQRQGAGMRTRGGPFKVFAIMPFAPAFDVVHTALRSAFTDKLTESYLGASVDFTRADDKRTGSIDTSILDSIREADLLVADLTGNNQNVLFEYGYGLALGKKIILINQNPRETVTDLRNQKQIPYDVAQLGENNKHSQLLVHLITATQELVADRKDDLDQRACSGDEYAECAAVRSGFNCIFRDQWKQRLNCQLADIQQQDCG